MSAGPGRISAFDVSPDGSQLLVVADGSGRPQPWLLPASQAGQAGGDGGPAPRLIGVGGAVVRAAWRPDGRRFAVEADPDGREDNRLVQVDPRSGTVEYIAGQPGQRTLLGAPFATAGSPYSPDGSLLAFASNRRAADCFDVMVADLKTGAERTVLTAGQDGVPEDRYFPVTFSWDSRELLAIRLHQNTEHDVYAIDLATGQARLLTRRGGPAKYHLAAARPEGVYLCATRDGDFTGLALLDPRGELRWIDTPEHDIEAAAVSADGSRLAWSVSEDGYTALRQCEIRAGVPRQARPVGGLPRGAYVFPDGMFGHALRLSADGNRLFVLDDQPGGTPALWCADLAGGTGAQRITPAADVPAASARPLPVRPAVARFASADGTPVSGLLYRPAGAGPFPAVLNIHGGPEAQAMPVSDPLTDGLVARGIAVLAPNIRGSSGYGLRFQRKIYRDWGGGDLADLRAAAEFLTALPWVDPDRIGVYGASYGGFAALSCLTRLPAYWRAGVSECGVSDLLEDVRSFQASWRRRARDWVGDIDDPDDVRQLREVSPLTHAGQVRAPVLLIHGVNDTNVAVESSDAFCARLRELGRPVRYERIDGAGHHIGRSAAGTVALVRDWLVQELSG